LLERELKLSKEESRYYSRLYNQVQKNPNTSQNYKKCAVLGDLHFPFHDENALTDACHHIQRFKPDIIILNGDIVNNYAISPFRKDLRMEYCEEVKQDRRLLSAFNIEVRKANPQKIRWQRGNHDKWYYNYLRDKAPELEGIPGHNFETAFGLDELGWEYDDASEASYQFYEFYITHGTKMSGARVHPARCTWLKHYDCIIYGHIHRTDSEERHGSISRNHYSVFTVGCLCDLHPDFDPLNQWNHGMATLERKNGKTIVDNIHL
jgi:predicted phosphodiesterase